MLTMLDSQIIHALVNFTRLTDMLHHFHDEIASGEPAQLELLQKIHSSLEPIEKTATTLHFTASKAAAERCRYNIQELFLKPIWNRNDINALKHNCAYVAQATQDELQAQLVFVIKPSGADLVRSGEPKFGQDVEDAFPSASEDIEEAAQCLAFGRYTAAVFHLMRAMEAAVKSLAAKVGVQNVDKEWGKLLSDISGAIEAMPKGSERDQWSESRTHLYHVKQAWRNNTMHPKATYTDEQAFAVYQAVKSFMAHLAPLRAKH